MPVDTQRLAELLAQGKTLREAADIIEGPNDRLTPEELAAKARLADLRGDSVPPGAEPKTPLWTGAYEKFHDARRQGLRREVAGARALEDVIAAAADPQDPRHAQAIYDPQRWHEEHRG